MSWIAIIFKVLMALPQIIALIKEINALINQIKSPLLQQVHRRTLRDLLADMRARGVTIQNVSQLHELKDMAQKSAALNE